MTKAEKDEIRERVREGELRSLTVTKYTGGPRVSWREFSTEGYYWLKIDVTKDQLKKIDDVAMGLSDRKDTSFDLIGMIRCAMCPRPHPKAEQTQWFCSQVIVYTLQEADLLVKELNASALHPNDVFLICYRVLDGEGCNHPLSSETTGPDMSAVRAYCFNRGLDPTLPIPEGHFLSIIEVARVLDDNKTGELESRYGESI